MCLRSDVSEIYKEKTYPMGVSCMLYFMWGVRCAYLCCCVHARAHTHMCELEWRLEGNIRCHYQSFSPFSVLKQGISLN